MRQLTHEQQLKLAEVAGAPTRSANFAILKAIIEHGELLEDGRYQISTRKIADYALCGITVVYRRIRMMQNLGLIQRERSGREVRKDDGIPLDTGIYKVLVEL